MLKEKDIKFISKQFSMKSKSLLSVSNVYMGFLKGDTGEILSSEIKSWNYYEEDVQALLMKTFKKVYSGKPDIKIFCPKFLDETIDTIDSMYDFVTDIDSSSRDSFKEKCDSIVSHIGENHIYNENMVFIAMNGSIHKDGVARNIFVGTLCKVKQGDTNFIYKMSKKEDDDDNDEDSDFTHCFKFTSSIDCIINLSSPVDGITYPILTDGTALRDMIGYYSSKSNKPDTVLISNVFGCDVKLTAQQENIFFTKILNTITDSKMSANDLYNVYNHLRNNVSDGDTSEEDIVIESIEISKAMEGCDINKIIEVKDAFKQVFGFENYTFKMVNVLPPVEKKSISISNDDADIRLKPDSLQNLKQVQDENGQVFLMIPMSENATTNGFELPIEQL